MRLRIDLALEQTRGAFDRQFADLAAQAFAGARTLARASSCACVTRRAASAAAVALGLVDHLVRALACLIEDLRGRCAPLG